MKKLALSIIVIFLVACGGETKKENEIKNESNTATEESIVEAEKEIVEIKVTAMGETMAEIKFEPASISVPENSRIILTLENKSSAEGMLHNFVLVELGSGAEIATAGMKAGEANNFVPDDNRVYAHSKVTNMGETVTIEFDAPAKGSYHYICTYPGHTNMIGRLNVI